MTGPFHGSAPDLSSSSEVNGQAELKELVPLIERELHRLARHYLARERPGHTLQSTELVNEAYLRLANQRGMRWHDRAHFVAIAAQAMRRILVDHARRRNYQKHGAGAVPVSLSSADLESGEPAAEITALNDALVRLEELDPRQARVVELRFFGGLTISETARAMSISTDTVKRDWTTAKAWLYRDMTGHSI